MQDTLNTLNINVIHDIIRLDKEARSKVAQAKEEADRITADAKLQKQKLFESYRNEAQAKVDLFEKTARAEADAKIAELEADRQKKTELLDKKMAENRERWKKEIVSAITGG